MNETGSPQQDAKQATLSPVTTSAPAAARPSGVRRVLLTTLILGVLGAVFGAVLGYATAQPCSPQQEICILSPGASALVGAVVFGLGGAGVGLVGSLLWLLGRTIARNRSGSRGVAG